MRIPILKLGVYLPTTQECVELWYLRTRTQAGPPLPSLSQEPRTRRFGLQPRRPPIRSP
jgi:hypothetical protein